MAQLMPLPHTVSCFSKIQIGFTFLVPAHLGSPGKKAVRPLMVLNVCVYVCVGNECSIQRGHLRFFVEFFVPESSHVMWSVRPDQVKFFIAFGVRYVGTNEV